MNNIFKDRYPLITNILEAYLRPNIDSYNLLITIHSVMKDSPQEMAEGLVDEFKRLTEEFDLKDVDIVQMFNTEIPKEYWIMDVSNIRQLLLTLSEYIIFLYDIENIRGSNKWKIKED